MDLLDLGDIIDIKNTPNALPADKEELALGNRAEWPCKIPQPRLGHLVDKLENMASAYKADAKAREKYEEKYEEKLINELNRKRNTAANFQKLYDDDQYFETNLNPAEEGTGTPKNKGENPGTGIAGTEDSYPDLQEVNENSTDPSLEEAIKRSHDPKEQVDPTEFTAEQFRNFQLEEKARYKPDEPEGPTPVPGPISAPLGPYVPPLAFQGSSGQSRRASPKPRGEKLKDMQSGWRRGNRGRK